MAGETAKQELFRRVREKAGIPAPTPTQKELFEKVEKASGVGGGRSTAGRPRTSTPESPMTSKISPVTSISKPQATGGVTIQKQIAEKERLPTYKEFRETLTVQSFKRPEKLGERYRLRISEASERMYQRPTTKKEKFTAIAGQFSLPFVETGVFIKSVVTKPKKTIKETGESLKIVTGRVKTGQGFPELGKFVREKPLLATARVGGEVALIKSPSLIAKGVRRVRAVGLKKIPAKKLIAPEYFKGERYPSIRKGQTAKQLMKEFKPILPKETKPAGFTASPNPFAKTTIARKGTSEFVGVYQAPKVSPHFLRLSSEERKLFTLKPFGETLRPSIIRITPKKFKLAPTVKPTTKVITGKTSVLKKFFKTKAEEGVSYIHFAKPEKEAVLTAGTKLKRTGKRFYISFKKTRVPIYEYKTVTKVKTPTTIFKKPKLTTVKKVSKISSSRRIGRAGLISPSEVLQASRVARRISSSKVSFRPSRMIKVSRPRKMISRVSVISPSRVARPSISRISRIERPLISKARPSRAVTKPKIRLFPAKPKQIFPSPSKRRRPPTSVFLRPQPQAFQPSLTASILKIRGKKPRPLLGKFKFGYTPSLRPLTV